MEVPKDVYSFDGTGYSNLERPNKWISKSFILSLGVKTYAEEALLYFMASEDQVC